MLYGKYQVKKDGWQTSKKDVNVTSSFPWKVCKPFILELLMSDFMIIINQTQICHKISKIQILQLNVLFSVSFCFDVVYRTGVFFVFVEF